MTTGGQHVTDGRVAQSTDHPQPMRVASPGALLAALAGVLLVAAPAGAWRSGDGSGDGTVAVDQAGAAVDAGLGNPPRPDCAAFDADGSGDVTIDQRVRIAGNASGCAGATCSAGRVTIGVLNRRGASAATTVLLSGRLVSGSPPAASTPDTAYTRSLIVPATCSGSCTCGADTRCTCQPGGIARCAYTPTNLAAGEWLHRIEVPGSGQQQSLRGLVMGDAAAPAALQWTAFRSVLTVTSPLDDGGPGTLRRAITTASGGRAAPPTLIQFDHSRYADGPMTIRLTDAAQLRVTKETIVDGTDADGQPSPLTPFASRSYRTIIELDPSDKGVANAATLRITSAGSGLRGLYLRRILGADAVIARRDQDLVAFGRGAHRGFIDVCKLDGGSAHRGMQDCPGNSRAAATNPAQGKDCIDVEASGSRLFADAVVVSQSELRHCYDRAVKSQDAATIVRRSWIHHNGRGGLFAQHSGGRLQAVDNLIEENGRNCPQAARCRGGPRDRLSCCSWGLAGGACRAAPELPAACPGVTDAGCGSGTCLPLDALPDVSEAACGVSAVRRAASQLSAESGGGTDLRTQRNVVRNGMRNGLFLRNGSTGAARDDFVCGMQFGIEAASGAGRAGQIVVSGVASVLNSQAGVLLNQQDTALADITCGDATTRPPAVGRNAFTNNGAGRSPAANFSMGSVRARRSAQGNQWQHGGNGATCRAAAVTSGDVAAANPGLDVAPCEAPRNPTGGTRVLDVIPAAARAGDIVHIVGSGFNAVDGYDSNDGPGGATSCTDLAAGNSCGPLPRGTCVEFERLDGGWSPAAAVLAVTPTHLVVRSPIDCVAPRRVRVRRKGPDGRAQTFTSAAAIFCRNE